MSNKVIGPDLQIEQSVGVEVVRRPKLVKPFQLETSHLNPRGMFELEHWRDGKLLGVHHFPNGIVNEGKNKLLDVMFHNQTQLATWYIGLIDFSGFTALAAGDNYDNIDQAGNGWDEYQSYTDANNSDNATTRPEWQENAASGEAITNTTTAIYDITGTTDKVKGVFVVAGTNGQTKGDHAPTVNFLWATALFTSGDLSITSGDQIKVTYTVST